MARTRAEVSGVRVRHQVDGRYNAFARGGSGSFLRAVRRLCTVAWALGGLAGCSEEASCPEGYARDGGVCVVSGSGAGDSGSGGGGGSGSACGECPERTPICDETTETCVVCLGEQGCEGDTPACLVGDTPAANRCVACTPEKEADLCKNEEDQPSSCNPATYTCTNTQLGSLRDCRNCVSDSECEDTRKCVPMNFKGNARDGGYCLAPSPGCPRPYTIELDDRVSLSGAEAADYCGVDEGATTCEAVRQYKNESVPCTEPTSCGAPGLDDSLCELQDSATETTCTYPCGRSQHCPDSTECTCSGSGCTDYCGG